MSDDAPEVQEEQESKKGGGIFKIAIAALIVVLAAGGGFGTYLFLLAPMLAPPEDEVDSEPREYIPMAPVSFDFDPDYVNVIMEDENVPASTLVYQVSFECNNQGTFDLIERHKRRFTSLVRSLHLSQERAVLDDTASFEKTVHRIALQQANDLLTKLQEKPNAEIRVTAVFHLNLMVDDKL